MPFKQLFNGTEQTTIANDDRIATGKPTEAGAKWISWANFLSFLNTKLVSLTTIQTISAVKTFNVSPLVPNPTTGNQAVNLTTLNSFTSGSLKKQQELNINSAIDFDLPAFHKIVGCDILPLTGDADVKIGDSLGASNIMSLRSVKSTEDIKSITLNNPSKNARTIHVTVTGGGDVSVNVWYLSSIF